ncbi:hypothetical protein T484DRAFT_1743709 [Baffinella frigidus]|nr:hypothetical protein T484DRAFT_1743709 [Cryptophyta sp. CCMP2293]
MAKKAALLAAALLLAAAALDVSGVTGRSVLLESSEEAEGKYSGAFGSMHALEKEAASFGSGGAAPISSEKARSTYDAAFGRLDALQKFADQVDRHDGVLGRRSSHRSKHHAKHAGESLAQRAPAPMRAERHRAARGRSVQPTFKALDPFNEGVVMPPGGEPAAHGHLDAGRFPVLAQQHLPHDHQQETCAPGCSAPPLHPFLVRAPPLRPPTAQALLAQMQAVLTRTRACRARGAPAVAQGAAPRGRIRPRV